MYPPILLLRKGKIIHFTKVLCICTIIYLNIYFYNKRYTHPLISVTYPSFFNFLTEQIKHLQIHIVQRGAVRPLIEMLQSPDVQLREMSAFALGRLAQVL